MRFVLLLLLLTTPAGAKSSAPAVSYTGKNSVPVPTTTYKPPVVNPNTKRYVYRYVTPCGMIKECRK